MDDGTRVDETAGASAACGVGGAWRFGRVPVKLSMKLNGAYPANSRQALQSLRSHIAKPSLPHISLRTPCPT